MKKVIVGLLVFAVLMQICPVFADMSVVEKCNTYQSQSKNPWIALGLTNIFPSLGHFYDGEWLKGVPFLLADVGAALLMTESYKDPENRNDTAGYLGAVVLVVSKIWETSDAFSIANEKNKKLRAELGIKNIKLIDPRSSDLDDVLAMYLNEDTQYTTGAGINTIIAGAITKDGIGFPRNLYGFQSLLGTSHVLVYGGHPSIDQVASAYERVKASKSDEEIRQAGMMNLLKKEFNNSVFSYVEYGTIYFAVPVNIYWGQFYQLSENSRIKWGVGLPTLISLGYSYDF